MHISDEEYNLMWQEGFAKCKLGKMWKTNHDSILVKLLHAKPLFGVHQRNQLNTVHGYVLSSW